MKNNKVWIFGLVGIVLIGVLVYFLLPSSKSSSSGSKNKINMSKTTDPTQSPADMADTTVQTSDSGDMEIIPIS